jgi:FMN phosphatase YigB (HAD superfamily)
MGIKAIIFDLDNCLAPATAVGEDLYAPAFAAIRAANAGTVPADALDAAFTEMWRTPFDRVAATYGFSTAMFDAGWQIFRAMELASPMHDYGDLEGLADLPVQRFIVTSGFRRLQESKIAALNLKSLCAEILVDAIDEPERLGKEGLFRGILERHCLQPDEVLVVGDSAESEIAAGTRLGIRTVQTLRRGVTKTDTATFHVHSLRELKALLTDARLAIEGTCSANAQS